MRLPPCGRCGGYMMPRRDREIYCLMCGHIDHGYRVQQPADVERRAASHASRDLHRQSTRKWGFGSRAMIK